MERPASKLTITNKTLEITEVPREQDQRKREATGDVEAVWGFCFVFVRVKN